MGMLKKTGEIFEDLATEIEDELLFETFSDLNPDIKSLNNINNKNSNYNKLQLEKSNILS